ncbi:hypothetical protein DRO30_02285 [Candidatus Bathyarchaeota archaeon]|nr:MAG: hypothetical protein DRO30_02285 [Candidatus Bathyarchaeota archaeon]
MVFSWIVSILRPLGMAFRHIFKYRFTVKYPYYVLETSERYRGRPVLDLAKCVGCGVCATICPNKAITMVNVENRKYPQFDAGRCCFCGFCAYFCLTSALKLTGGYELSEYDKSNLIYPPEKLIKVPPPPPERKKVVKLKKLSLSTGVTHG